MIELEKGIRYEVALEILGQSLQPFLNAIEDERKKASPSEALIRYCQNRIHAVTELQDDLRATDADTIDLILDKKAAAVLQLR